MPGMPGGKQFAVSLSSAPLARAASLFAAYSGVRDGPAGAPPLPRPPPPPPDCSQTPVKSGSFAIAVQSAAVGGFGVLVWAKADEKTNKTRTKVMKSLCVIAEDYR